MRKETIAAISTGMTNSGIGIVRISGEEAVLVADRIYRGKKKLCEVKSHTINYGYIVDREISSAEKKSEEVIDEVLVTVMKAPGTFTGEDTVEINCHGGTFVVKKVLELVLKNGASPAEPGEFTKRAFLNGKMDLSQAEAVIDVINSENEYALQSSVSQLKGSVKKKINDIREKIIYHTAFIETALDDPEHISVDGYSDTLRSSAEEIIQELERLIHSADDGRVIKEGIKTVIVGKPNAGKSSLLNVLAGHERAIVTDIEGTTRDVLEETIKLGVLNLNVVDTAGIRQTEDLIEKIGVDKALEYAETADLIIYVVDASRSLDENDEKIINMISDKKSIVLLNKSDIDTVISAEHIKEKVSNIPIISISAKEERGINQKEKEAILSIPLDYSFMKNEEKLSVVERFQQHAGVKDVLLADIAYTQGVSGNLLMTEKGNDNSWTDINIMCVPLNFFAFMNIPIEEGRTIRTKNDLVMDKVWQNKQKKNVIGMNFYDQNNDYTVCGVCTPFQTDVHYHSGGYAFMLYDPSEYVGHCYVKCYPEQQKEVVKWIEKIRREVLPENISYQVRTFQDDLYEIQAMEYMLKDTILFFAIVSIIITLLGVYSSITLDTERRQKEVAIRKVNGAGMSHIIWLFTRLYITLLMVTAALSFPLVYLVLQLWKQIYTVFFNCGFWFWTGIFISVAMITALTIWFRILKIARVNPVESIKNE